MRAVEGGVEPEPALGRTIELHLHIGDQEAVAKHAAGAVLTCQCAQRRAAAVASNDMLGTQRIRPVWRVDRQKRMLVVLLDADDLVIPAQVDSRQLGGALSQVAFDVVLLQVDERRPKLGRPARFGRLGWLAAGLGEQVEPVDLCVAEEHLADVPRDTLVDHALPAAESVEDLERALGEANRARAGRQRVFVVEQHDACAALREVDRERQADRPGPDNDNRVASRLDGILVGMARVVEAQRLEVDGLGRHDFSFPTRSTSPHPAARSRCAGQGTWSPRRSSASRRTACSGRR